MKKLKKTKKEVLTPKKELFCKEFLVDLNGTQAAIRAGYSEKTANEQAARLLATVSVQARINELKTKRAEKIEVKSDDVLRELVKLANSDIRKVFEEDGKMKPMSEWPDEIAACVSSVEVEELFEWEEENGRKEKKHIGYLTKVKFWDKTKCLDMLGRHLKLFGVEDKNTGPAMILVQNGAILDKA